MDSLWGQPKFLCFVADVDHTLSPVQGECDCHSSIPGAGGMVWKSKRETQKGNDYDSKSSF